LSLSRLTSPPATAIYPLSLHDALPIFRHPRLESPVPLVVERSRPHKRVLLLKFREWNNINDAEPYKGGELMVEGSEVLDLDEGEDRKSTRLNSSHVKISYAVFCLKKKK